MAAGLSIICNDLDFVKSVVVGNGIGTSVNFNNQDALRTMINQFVNSRPELADMSRKARNLYRESCNWQTVSRGMYERLRVAVGKRPGVARPELDVSWIEGARKMRRSFFPQSSERYLRQIAHLNEVYPAEIERISDVYVGQIRGLQNDITNLNAVYSAEIQRYGEEVQQRNSEIERLHVVYREAIQQRDIGVERLTAELQYFRRFRTAARRIPGAGILLWFLRLVPRAFRKLLGIATKV